MEEFTSDALSNDDKEMSLKKVHYENQPFD